MAGLSAASWQDKKAAAGALAAAFASPSPGVDYAWAAEAAVVLLGAATGGFKALNNAVVLAGVAGAIEAAATAAAPPAPHMPRRAVAAAVDGLGPWLKEKKGGVVVTGEAGEAMFNGPG